MAIMEGLTEIFTGIIGVIILGAFIVAIYPTAQASYGNSTVFLLGSVVMLIVGIIPLFYLFGVMQSGFKKLTGRQPSSIGGGGFEQ